MPFALILRFFLVKSRTRSSFFLESKGLYWVIECLQKLMEQDPHSGGSLGSGEAVVYLGSIDYT